MRAHLMTLIGLVSLTLAPASAHDFWIEPISYAVQDEDPIPISAKIGHGAEQSAWPILAQRIVGLRSLGPSGLIDQQSAVKSEQDGAFDVTLSGDGVHIVFMESSNSYSELAAEKFDEYVDEEGVLPIQTHRATRADITGSGKELYSRRGKTLIQVGDASAPDDHVTQPVGLTLEIVPQSNPFRQKAGAPFSFSVLYRGRPLKGATVHVTQLNQPDVAMQVQTNAVGIAKIDELPSGSWLLHSVWGEPARGLLNEADYISVFSSLTFKID